jgi:hypothetical protein
MPEPELPELRRTMALYKFNQRFSNDILHSYSNDTSEAYVLFLASKGDVNRLEKPQFSIDIIKRAKRFCGNSLDEITLMGTEILDEWITLIDRLETVAKKKMSQEDELGW